MIRDLEEAELHAAGALAAAAFREDPGFSHILRGDGFRRARLPSMLAALLGVDRDAGARVRGAFDGDALVGVSSTLPARTAEPDIASWVRRLPAMPWVLLSPGTVLRGLEVANAIARLRPASSDYLHLLAVHPACHGRGIGAALLRDSCPKGRSVYLETFEPANRAWYSARGFTETAEVRSAARPPFWTFLRKA